MRQARPVLSMLINIDGVGSFANTLHTLQSRTELPPSVSTNQKGRRPLIKGRKAITF